MCPAVAQKAGKYGLEDLGKLRGALVSYVKRKFLSRPNITDMAEEIVNQAFLDIMKAKDFHDGLLNFGYMSTACVRVAYKVFHRNDSDASNMISLGLTMPLIGEDDFVSEVENAEDSALIFRSLQTLKQIERIVITERYYGDFSFREISESHGINLNTVLSHHRRALEKLRPVLAQYFSYGAPKYHYGDEK